MPALDPGQRIRDLENILEYMLGEPLRITQRGETGYIDVGEAAGVGVTGTVDVGDLELRAQVFTEIKGQSIHGVAEIAAMQIVQKALGESMGIPNTQELSARIADARATIGSTPQRPQRPRLLAAHVAETVGTKDLILLAEAVIQADVERILIVQLVLIGEIVVRECSGIGRLGIKIGNVLPHLIDAQRKRTLRRNDVRSEE